MLLQALATILRLPRTWTSRLRWTGCAAFCSITRCPSASVLLHFPNFLFASCINYFEYYAQLCRSNIRPSLSTALTSLRQLGSFDAAIAKFKIALQLLKVFIHFRILSRIVNMNDPWNAPVVAQYLRRLHDQRHDQFGTGVFRTEFNREGDDNDNANMLMMFFIVSSFVNQSHCLFCH